MKQVSMQLMDRRVRLAELLLNIDEEALITTLEQLIGSAIVGRPATALSQEELNSRLDEAMADAHAGRAITGNELLKEVEDWK